MRRSCKLPVAMSAEVTARVIPKNDSIVIFAGLFSRKKLRRQGPTVLLHGSGCAIAKEGSLCVRIAERGALEKAQWIKLIGVPYTIAYGFFPREENR